VVSYFKRKESSTTILRKDQNLAVIRLYFPYFAMETEENQDNSDSRQSAASEMSGDYLPNMATASSPVQYIQNSPSLPAM
jgi:hypothetical protein